MTSSQSKRPASTNTDNAAKKHKAESEAKERVTNLRRYNDPRSDLHLVSSDHVVFKVHMHLIGDQSSEIANLLETRRTTLAGNRGSSAAVMGTRSSRLRLDVPAPSATLIKLLDSMLHIPLACDDDDEEKDPYYFWVHLDMDGLIDALLAAERLGCRTEFEVIRSTILLTASSAADLFMRAQAMDWNMTILRAGFRVLSRSDKLEIDDMRDLPQPLLCAIVAQVYGKAEYVGSDSSDFGETDCKAVLSKLADTLRKNDLAPDATKPSSLAR